MLRYFKLLKYLVRVVRILTFALFVLPKCRFLDVSLLAPHLDFADVRLYAFFMSQRDHRIDEFIHPELHENEIFFANTDWNGFRKMRWQTKRKGLVAYDGKGTKLSHADWFPVFLDPDELEKAQVSLAIARQQL